MFRFSSHYHRFLSVLLPATLFLSWIGCVTVCTEGTEQRNETHAVWKTNTDKEAESVCASTDLFSCSFTGASATLQDRQNFNISLLKGEEVTISHSHNLTFFPSSVHEPDFNQNSPPKITNPLFLQFHNFRI